MASVENICHAHNCEASVVDGRIIASLGDSQNNQNDEMGLSQGDYQNHQEELNCNTPITTIFFDMDNTLIPTRKGDAKACSKIADLLQTEHGLTRETATDIGNTYLTAFRRCPDNPDLPLAQWRTQLWEDSLPVGHKHLAHQLYTRWLEYRTRYLAPGAEVIAMLKSLRRNYLLGIISNGPSAAQWEKIDRLALNRYFDCILISADLPWAKPDRNIFYAACHYLGVRPDECAMIGDKLETDVQGGVESKLGATIWLPLPKDLCLMHDKTLADLDDHIRPDCVVHNLLDLPAVLPKQPDTFFRGHQQRLQQRPLEGRRGSDSFIPKTTRNREASYNRFLPDVPDLFSCSSNSCDSNGSTESN
ncbi:N-acylneuraminate-9-phosphatase-like [Sabethes cyaneus]|uniref:N-acylneuraminate-9-phosphatase-like n=1 Tax=Sabethes cyaneus TaxID=53552 RepID=UPI00237E1013|nr:N-acylneuraminate-9-phosphatase-like [Sabethes cyaneus]